MRCSFAVGWLRSFGVAVVGSPTDLLYSSRDRIATKWPSFCGTCERLWLCEGEECRFSGKRLGENFKKINVKCTYEGYGVLLGPIQLYGSINASPHTYFKCLLYAPHLGVVFSDSSHRIGTVIGSRYRTRLQMCRT